MADQLAASDRTDIFAAFSDLYDTFFQYTAAFQIKKRALPVFNEDVSVQYTSTETAVRCLPVAEKTGTNAQNDVFQHGSADFSEGYILCALKDLTAASLATQTKINVLAGLDTLKLDGVEYDIIGVNFVGPLKEISTDRVVLAKFHIKKKLTKNIG